MLNAYSIRYLGRDLRISSLSRLGDGEDRITYNIEVLGSDDLIR